MAKNTVKTIALATGEVKEINAIRRNAIIRNNGSNTVYASSTNDVGAGVDGTMSVGAGTSALVRDVGTSAGGDGKLYLLCNGGETAVEVEFIDDTNFKSVTKGGGGGGEPVDAYTKGEVDGFLAQKVGYDDYASELKSGVVKINANDGVTIIKDGVGKGALAIVPAMQNDFDTKNPYKAVTPANLDLAMKKYGINDTTHISGIELDIANLEEDLSDKLSIDDVPDTMAEYDIDKTTVTTIQNKIEEIAKRVHLYGFHIDGKNPNPSEAVTYLEDAVGMTPAYMNYSTGVFDYGSWKNAFFMPRPCMLNFDGTVAYYLDENDYTKKTDGTASDVANIDFSGNAMMEWGRGGRKIWYKIVPDKNDVNSASIYISDEQIDNGFHAYSFINNKGKYTDHFYTPIYNGSLDNSNKLRSISGQTIVWEKTAEQEITYAKANGDGWFTEVYGDIELINILLVLMGKSLNTQAVYGVGNMSGYVNDKNAKYGTTDIGSMNNKGLFWGKNTSSASDNSGVKVFGMENYWGNQWRRFAGYVLDGTNGVKIKRCYGADDGSTVFNYPTTGLTTPSVYTGFVSTGVVPLGTSGEYINEVDYSSNAIIPAKSSGSETTYICDGQWFGNNAGLVNYALRGGTGLNGLHCGAFYMHLNTAPNIMNWYIGSAPSYK